MQASHTPNLPCATACRQSTATNGGHPCRPCRPARQDRDTSWQHKPLKPLRSVGSSTPRLARTSASLASSSEATLSPVRSGGARSAAGMAGGVVDVAVAPSMAPASVLLSRTFSGPAVSSLGGSAKLGPTSLAQRHKVLQRLSFTGSVRWAAGRARWGRGWVSSWGARVSGAGKGRQGTAPGRSQPCCLAYLRPSSPSACISLYSALDLFKDASTVLPPGPPSPDSTLPPLRTPHMRACLLQGTGSRDPSMHGSGTYALAVKAAADAEERQTSGLSR